MIIRFCVTLLSLSLLTALPVTAQPDLAGEINLEDVTDEQKNPYGENQSEAIRFMDKLDALAETLGSTGAGGAAGEISENTMIHLTNVFLYCSLKRGTCSMVLEAILESDVINSLDARNVACPNMARFWKVWVRGDMEKRQKYLMPTAHMSAANQFATQERPRFIRCRETIEGFLAGAGDPAQLRRERYGKGAPAREAIRRTAQLLNEIKLKVPNVPQAIEAMR